MHQLIRNSIRALEQPGFRDMFIEFLALQRYDLKPYVRIFAKLDVDDRFQDGIVTVGGAETSAAELATRFVEFLISSCSEHELAELAEEFWSVFSEAVGEAGPRECVAARRKLGGDHERLCLMAMLRPALLALTPRRILDFGCGSNRLAPVLQEEYRRAGHPVPTVIGVDVNLPQDAYVDPARGIHLHELRSQSLSSILGGPVDLIILTYVMHHMTQAEQSNALEMLATALGPAGKLVVLEASVDANGDDLARFERAQRTHETWPREGWVDAYRRVSRRFYQADANEQRMLLCLEDVFGHVLLPGPAVAPPSMPLPFSYVGRDAVARLARQSGLEPVDELAAVLGMPPTLKHGPPSSLYVFQHGP
jgi:SAM-dependent methyltransferase